MGYSCADFVDTILDALNIELPEEAYDDPGSQADLALSAIARLNKAPAQASRDLKRAIYLSGLKGSGNGYTVHHDIPGEAIICSVPTVSVGNAIVRALRARAMALKPA